MNNADKIQLVIDTLQQLELRASYDNMNHLLGCLQALTEIQSSVRDIEECRCKKDDNVKTEVLDCGRAD